MLKAHMDAVENNLLSTAKIPANSGHSLHKGTPREAFIKEFLEGHLSESVAIGTGEIIDANSQPQQPRNQHDIVIFKRNYPRLALGGGINAFLAESVVATIEVKSTLTKEEFKRATVSACNTKSLYRNFGMFLRSEYHPPAILSYVVAYDGPAQMSTVHDWISSTSWDTEVYYPTLPRDDKARLATASPALDAVIVLGRGFMHYGNALTGFFRPEFLDEHPDVKWAVSDSPDGNLLLLFMFLTTAVSRIYLSSLDPTPYLRTYAAHGLKVMP
jgi:hypothetical protein